MYLIITQHKLKGSIDQKLGYWVNLHIFRYDKEIIIKSRYVFLQRR